MMLRLIEADGTGVLVVPCLIVFESGIGVGIETILAWRVPIVEAVEAAENFKVVRDKEEEEDVKTTSD